MSAPPYLHISMVLDRPSLGRLYDQVEASTGFPGFVSYRMFGPPGSRQDQANMIAWLHQIRWEWLYDRLNSVAVAVECRALAAPHRGRASGITVHALHARRGVCVAF